MDKLYQDGTKCPQIENLEKNNARTGGGIRAIRRTRPTHATPVFHFPQTGNLE